MLKIANVSLFQISSTIFCQILSKLVHSWENYRKTTKVNFFDTHCSCHPDIFANEVISRCYTLSRYVCLFVTTAQGACKISQILLDIS